DEVLGEVINIGSGFEISVGDTAHAIAEIMGVEINVELDKQRVRPQASEVERLLAGIDKARAQLGWEPRYGGKEGFQRGLAETIAWYTNKANLAAYVADRYNI